jgi:hypothetical protein
MSKFSWLHLTDLHYGMGEQKHLWPNIKDKFFEDLKKLHERSGPWDVVFFTGDLVQSGAWEEFAGLNKLLGHLWTRLKELSSDPLLIPIPGNHDLVRPTLKSAAFRVLTKWEVHPEIHEEFWEERSSEYRVVIDRAFINYLKWLETCPFASALKKRGGLIPGDLAYTYEKGDLKVGIVGLNTAFLQLSGGDYSNRLALSQRQFHEVCNGDGPEWLKQHSVSLLLTHHPVSWLNEKSQKQDYVEIAPPGRFAAHLFGHMHEPTIQSVSVGGGPTIRAWQGCSLFGLESYGEDNLKSRSHGYSSGQIEIKNGVGSIRLWPRIAQRHEVNGWMIIPDNNNFILESDEGTRPEQFEVRTFSSEMDRQIITPISEYDPDKFIGRESERELFEKLLTFETDARILTIRASGGDGKSYLLAKFQDCCLTRIPRIPISYIALDQLPDNSPLTLVQSIVDDLEPFRITFHNFDRDEEARINPRISTTIVRPENNETISVSNAPVPLTPEQEKRARKNSIRSFFEDLRSYCTEKHVVIMFDSYEKCEPNLKDWIIRHFLEQGFFSDDCNSRLLALVIAGKEVPAIRLPEQVRDTVLLTVNELTRWTKDNVRECLRAHGIGNYESSILDMLYGMVESGKPLLDVVQAIQLSNLNRSSND